MTDNAEELKLLKQQVLTLWTHLREHADLRGEIQALDRSCELCRTYFADELAIMTAGAS